MLLFFRVIKSNYAENCPYPLSAKQEVRVNDIEALSDRYDFEKQRSFNSGMQDPKYILIGSQPVLRVSRGCAKKNGKEWLVFDRLKVTNRSSHAENRTLIYQRPYGPHNRSTPTYLAHTIPINWMLGAYFAEHDAILPWLGFRGSSKNIYHAFSEVEREQSVNIVNAMSKHLRGCCRQRRDLHSKLFKEIVVLRQTPSSKGNNSNIGMETELLSRSTGFRNLYRLPENGQAYCFNTLYISVQSDLKQLPKPRCSIDTADMASMWYRVLNISNKRPLHSRYDICAALADHRAPSITIINRAKIRQIENLQQILKAIRARGWDVRNVRLECLSMDEQMRIMTNTTTLIGYHGAGLAWSRMLPLHAATIQVHGLPCLSVNEKSDFQNKMFNAGRGPYAVLHSVLHANNSKATQAHIDMICKAGKMRGIRDMRKMNATIDILELLRTIEREDPMLAPSDQLREECARSLEKAPRAAIDSPSEKNLPRCGCQQISGG